LNRSKPIKTDEPAVLKTSGLTASDKNDAVLVFLKKKKNEMPCLSSSKSFTEIDQKKKKVLIKKKRNREDKFHFY
jgi:hypothetical protein